MPLQSILERLKRIRLGLNGFEYQLYTGKGIEEARERTSRPASSRACMLGLGDGSGSTLTRTSSLDAHWTRRGVRVPPERAVPPAGRMSSMGDDEDEVMILTGIVGERWPGVCIAPRRGKKVSD